MPTPFEDDPTFWQRRWLDEVTLATGPRCVATALHRQLSERYEVLLNQAHEEQPDP